MVQVMHMCNEKKNHYLQLVPEILTQALGQGAIPGTVPLTGDGAGAQQVVARVTAIWHSSLEAVTVRPAGQYLPDAVLDVAWLRAVHD